MPDCWRWEMSEKEASVGWLPTLLVKVVRYFVMTLHSPSSSSISSGVPTRSVCPGPGGGEDLSQRSEVTGSMAIYLVYIVWKVALSMYGVWLWIWYIYVPSDVSCVSAHDSQPTCVDCFLSDLQYKILVGPHNNERGATLPCHVWCTSTVAGKNMWLNFVPRLHTCVHWCTCCFHTWCTYFVCWMLLSNQFFDLK